MIWFLRLTRYHFCWVYFGFEGLQGNWNGEMVVKYWEGEMSLQVGHGWLVAGMEGLLFSQMLGKLSVFLMPRVEGIPISVLMLIKLTSHNHYFNTILNCPKVEAQVNFEK